MKYHKVIYVVLWAQCYENCLKWNLLGILIKGRVLVSMWEFLSLSLGPQNNNDMGRVYSAI